MSLHGPDRHFEDHREALQALTNGEVDAATVQREFSNVEDIERLIGVALSKQTERKSPSELSDVVSIGPEV
ncbi:hypothetical protein [Halorubrum amylolyticum]|uniref:hypothetical protein n=1 Tax=Halorubrum amylolyticum TaxID=2508724 RepID=UPI0010092327|nr:hypothetical protein [Halorubrum amylolyticum]